MIFAFERDLFERGWLAPCRFAAIPASRVPSYRVSSYHGSRRVPQNQTMTISERRCLFPGRKAGLQLIAPSSDRAARSRVSLESSAAVIMPAWWTGAPKALAFFATSVSCPAELEADPPWHSRSLATRVCGCNSVRGRNALGAVAMSGIRACRVARSGRSRRFAPPVRQRRSHAVRAQEPRRSTASTNVFEICVYSVYPPTITTARPAMTIASEKNLRIV